MFFKNRLSDTNLHILVDKESSKLRCSNPYGCLYKFEQLPFGAKVAPAIFQQVMDTMLIGLEFKIAYLDDILMNSQSTEQYKAHVYEVFEIQDEGFKLKEKKCDFFNEKIKYLGQIIDKGNRSPGPEWASAIKTCLHFKVLLV